MMINWVNLRRGNACCCYNALDKNYSFQRNTGFFFRIISAEACFVLLFSQFLYPDDLVFESPIFFLRTRRATNFQTQIFDSSSAFQLNLHQDEDYFGPSTEDICSHLKRSNLK